MAHAGVRRTPKIVVFCVVSAFIGTLFLHTPPVLAQALSFLPVVTYDAGGFEPLSVAVVDVNGDGKSDLIVANLYACSYPLCLEGSVGVLLGNGDGTFQPVVNFSSNGSKTDSVAVADMNGDGKPDIIVANYCADSSNCFSGTVSLLLGNGDGTFQAARSYSSGGYGPQSVAVADVNGDGKRDVIVANREGGLGVLLGNGDGTFQSAVAQSSGSERGFSVAVADVNGDGKPDLLVGSTCISYPYNCEDLVGVLLGKGDGTFQPVVSYNSGDGYESSVAVADVNGDGKPDLLVANLDSNTIGVLLGNGDGSFQQAVTYDSSGIYALSVAVADVNGDGKPDVIVANEFPRTGFNGSVGVLLGNGDGTFQAALTYASGGQNNSAVTGDLNGDGRQDVVVSLYGEAIGVLLNNTPFCNTAPTITLSTTPKSLWPPNGSMVPVTISGTVIDAGSACTIQTAAYEVKDEYGEVQPGGPVTLGPGGAYSFTVLLQASRLGADMDGRVYTVTVRATNNVGKSALKVAYVAVPHDRGH